MQKSFRNPILPGFYPDPSICRVGEDYYLVTSSFEYFPGIPLFHSRDLVNWRQLGHVLSRPTQLNLDGIRPSGGVWAPTIRHHGGTFYVVNTLWDGDRERGSFIVTTRDIEGEWSEPTWLKDSAGIDPSLFFDEDGRAWYTANHPVPDGGFFGHCEIWMQELDLQSMQLTGLKYSLWDGALKEAPWVEAPHLYKVNGLYYLLVAEGGTGHNHSVTMARSKSIIGPYESCPRNPILTHRHLGLEYPIVGTGHADLVETQDGAWWMVLLAMRPYGGYFYNLGRETFLVPVGWEDGWPVVNPGIGNVPFEARVPNLPESPWPSVPTCDHFASPTLPPHWNFLRTPRDKFWSLTERADFLRMHLRPQTLAELANPAFIGRRQQHIHFSARAAMEFTPRAANESAGMVLVQNNDFHFRFVVTHEDGPVICLVKREKGEETILAKQPAPAGRVHLKVTAAGQKYSFYIGQEAENWLPVAEGVDGRILSSTVAGGFVGTYIGMYASSSGGLSENWVDWDWFDYSGLEPARG